MTQRRELHHILLKYAFLSEGIMLVDTFELGFAKPISAEGLQQHSMGVVPILSIHGQLHISTKFHAFITK